MALTIQPPQLYDSRVIRLIWNQLFHNCIRVNIFYRASNNLPRFFSTPADWNFPTWKSRDPGYPADWWVLPLLINRRNAIKIKISARSLRGGESKREAFPASARYNHLIFSGPRPLQQNSGHLRGCVEPGGDRCKLGQAPLVLVPLSCLSRDAPRLDSASPLQEVQGGSVGERDYLQRRIPAGESLMHSARRSVHERTSFSFFSIGISKGIRVGAV